MATNEANAVDLTRDEQLLKFFVQCCPQRLGRTQLVKLVYLADYYAHLYTGKPISSFAWKREPQGPFTEQFYSAKDGLAQKGQVRELEDRTPFGHPWYQYVDAGEALKPDFSPVEQRILRFIVDTYGGRSREEILAEVYETAPFKKVENSMRGTPVPMSIVNNERTAKIGGLTLSGIIAGERSLSAGRGVPLRVAVAVLRGTTPHAAPV